MIWPKEVTLVSRTQPSGPLCLWQCFIKMFTIVLSVIENSAINWFWLLPRLFALLRLSSCARGFPPCDGLLRVKISREEHLFIIVKLSKVRIMPQFHLLPKRHIRNLRKRNLLPKRPLRDKHKNHRESYLLPKRPIGGGRFAFRSWRLGHPAVALVAANRTTIE